MKRYLLLSLFFVFAICAQAIPVDLLDAKNQKKISIKSIGIGGYQGECVQLSVKNLTSTKQDIIVPPGLIFTCNDTTSQDLMVVDEYMLALMPGATRSLNLSTMCIKHHKGSPSKGDLFALNKRATGHLATLAELIAKNNLQNSTAQSAVWAITDNTSMYDVYATDTVMARELLSFVSKATGQPMPKIIPQKEHYIYAIKINITHHFAKATKVTLASYDETGNLIKLYYKDRLVPMGMYIASIGVNKVAEKGTKFIYRISDDKGNTIKERVIEETTIEPKAQKWRLDIGFDYMLENALTGSSMSLYDDKGNLLEDLYTNRDIPAGGRRQAYSFHHAFGQQSTFFLRLKDNTGKVVMEKKLDGSKSIVVP